MRLIRTHAYWPARRTIFIANFIYEPPFNTMSLLVPLYTIGVYRLGPEVASIPGILKIAATKSNSS